MHIPALAWLLLPLLLLGFTLAAGYSALTEERFPSFNGVSTPLLSGQSAGQSFVARYNNLSGIEVKLNTGAAGGSTTPATLVLHLRASVAGADLATATLPAGTALAPDGWDLFSFPPVAGSENKPFYFQVESPDGAEGRAASLFIWRGSNGDPYPGGTAYSNKQPLQADLAFGLHYAASPLDAYAQVARAASSNVSPPLLVALLVAAGAVILLLCLWLLPGRVAPRRAWRARLVLPLVLAVALINGLFYVLLVPAWQGPDEHAHFAYVALLDRYGLDNTLMQSGLEAGGGTDKALVAAINASMDRHDFTRLQAGNPSPGSPSNMGTSYFWETRQPEAYYWLAAVGLRAARAIGINADPYTNTDAALLVIRGVSLLLSLGVVALAWLAARLLSPRSLRMQLLLPVSIALFPMHAFVAATANNDILAELAVSALFVSLVALLKWPDGAKGTALALLTLVLAGASLQTKDTATAAVLPLLGLGWLAWIGLLATHGLRHDDARLDNRPAGRGMAKRRYAPGLTAASLLPLALVLLPVLAVAAFIAFGFAPDGTAAGWQLTSDPSLHPALVQSTTAHSGTGVLQVGPGSDTAIVQQTLIPGSIYHPAATITATVWARLAPATAGPMVAGISLLRGTGSPAGAQITLQPAGDWTQLQATAQIPAGAGRVALLVGGGPPAGQTTAAGAVQFDDASLQVTWAGAAWNDPVYAPHLVAPSFEQEGVSLRSLFVHLLPQQARQIAYTLANPQPFDVGALWRGYAENEYRSFWGNFGWVSLPLPDGAFMLLGVLLVLSLLGLLLRALRLAGRWGVGEWLGLISLASIAVAIFIGLARQTSLLANNNGAAYPQGRYLFVLAIPVAWLLISGLYSLYSVLADVVRFSLTRLHPTVAPAASVEPAADAAGAVSPAQAWRERKRASAGWLWLNALLLFALYCFLVLIVPYYYG